MSRVRGDQTTGPRDGRSRRAAGAGPARPLAVAALALAACGGRGPIATGPEHRPVVRTAIARLEAELEPPTTELAGGAEEDARERLGVVAGARGEARDAALAELVRLGDASVPLLTATFTSETADDGRRTAAIEALGALGALDSARAAAGLLWGVEHAADRRVRAACARELGRGTQAWVVPALVGRLPRETAPPVVMHVADALARLGNPSGIAVLRARLDSLPPDRHGLSEADLARFEETLTAPPAAGPPRGARYELEVWRQIAASDPEAAAEAEHVLPRLGETAAVLLGRALADEREEVRLRCARALEAMGPRGSVAGAVLVEALSDPALAPAAAAALGRVAYPAAEPALVASTAPERPLELRVAAARALGFLGLASSVGALRALLAAAEPPGLRQAAAESLVYAGAGELAIERLLAFMESERVDPASSEAAVGYWLARRAREGAPAAAEVVARWDALGDAPGVVADASAVAARCRDRARVVREALPRLLPS